MRIAQVYFSRKNSLNSCFVQWTTCKTVFVIYRTVLLLFHWGWLIAGWVLAKPDHYYTLTNWSVFFTGLYFLFAFVTSIYGITIKKDYSGPKTDPTLVTNQPSTTSGISKQGKVDSFLGHFTLHDCKYILI